MAQVNPRSFADAQKLGDQIYELILTNWGNRGMKQDPNNGSIMFPPIKSLANGATPLGPVNEFILPPIPSLSAIAISPRSLVDRCILNFTSLPQVPAERTTSVPVTGPNGGPSAPLNVSIQQGFVNNGGVLMTEQILSVGAPFIGQQPGPILVRAAPELWFDDLYVPEATSPNFGVLGANTFGTQLYMGPNNGGPIWVNPELRLLLYFSGKGALPPINRAPWAHSFGMAGINTVGVPSLVKVVPVMGRKQVTVSVQNGSVAGTVLSVFGTFNLIIPDSAAPFATNLTNLEVPLKDPVTLGISEGVELNVECCAHPGVSFLLIYLTNPGALLGADAAGSVMLY